MSNILEYLSAAPVRMPLPGETGFLDAKADSQDTQSPTTPTPTSPSPTSPRPSDGQGLPGPPGRRAQRRRSIEVVADAHGDVDAFMKELDQKRRQLDDQIHKFISQKEREFKLHERELRTRYRTCPPPQTITQTTTPEPTTKEEAVASHERETELLGLFTPAYLPLLESRPSLDRSPSAPILPTSDQPAAEGLNPDRQTLQRANTDPPGDRQMLRLGPRTLSSGSEVGRSLVSALKSPTAGPRLPKQQRVSLVVGDAVVAPSDNIPSEPSEHTSPVELTVQEPEPEPEPEPGPGPEPDSDPEIEPEPPSASLFKHSELIAQPETKQPSGLSLGFASASRGPDGTKESPLPLIDTDHDISLSSPFSMDEDLDDPHPSDMQASHIEDIDTENESAPESETTFRVESPPSPSANAPPPLVQSPTGLEIPDTRIRSASSSSAQPTSPGFSRPSVKADPQFDFTRHSSSYVESPAQGSLYDSFSRPSYQQHSVGSLGESFMQKNAEELMRRRKSSGPGRS